MEHRNVCHTLFMKIINANMAWPRKSAIFFPKRREKLMKGILEKIGNSSDIVRVLETNICHVDVWEGFKNPNSSARGGTPPLNGRIFF